MQRKKNIQWIHTRHEEYAALAAGAHAELLQLCNILKSPMVHALRGKEMDGRGAEIFKLAKTNLWH